MTLTGRNEWIVIGALILWIAFVPCPYQMKQFFASPIGKVLALGGVIYVWKFVSMPVAVLLLVAFLRSGAIREYLEGETGMVPPTAALSVNNYSCPSEYTYSPEKMMCAKGNETKNPTCNDPSMIWESTIGKCVTKPTTSGGGPAGGSTAGSMQALTDMANTSAAMNPSSSMPPSVEGFVPYGGGKKTEVFAGI